MQDLDYPKQQVMSKRVNLHDKCTCAHEGHVSSKHYENIKDKDRKLARVKRPLVCDILLFPFKIFTKPFSFLVKNTSFEILVITGVLGSILVVGMNSFISTTEKMHDAVITSGMRSAVLEVDSYAFSSSSDDDLSQVKFEHSFGHGFMWDITGTTKDYCIAGSVDSQDVSDVFYYDSQSNTTHSSDNKQGLCASNPPQYLIQSGGIN